MEDWWCPLEKLSQSTLQPLWLQIPRGPTTTFRSETILTGMRTGHGTTRLHSCRSWETFCLSPVRQSTWQAQTPSPSSARTEVLLWIPPSTLRTRTAITARCSLVATAWIHNHDKALEGTICIKVWLITYPFLLTYNIGPASCGTVAAVKHRPPIISIPPPPLPPFHSRFWLWNFLAIFQFFPCTKQLLQFVKRHSHSAGLRSLNVQPSYFIGPSAVEMVRIGNDSRINH